MKKSINLIASLLLILFLSSCSSVKVLDAWKADTVDSVKDNKILVIARTQNKQGRIAFENEIVKQLTASGMNATASFTKFPKLTPNKEVTEEKREMIKTILHDEGFNAVVLTVVKDVQESTKTVSDGGYYAGGTYGGAGYGGYYPSYYGGFGGYYHNRYSYSSYGVYTPSSSTTYTSKTYVLETVVYDLDEPEDKQLVAVVTSSIEDPNEAYKTAEAYVKAITKSFNEN